MRHRDWVERVGNTLPLLVAFLVIGALGCVQEDPTPAGGPDGGMGPATPQSVRAQLMRNNITPIPLEALNPLNPLTPAKIDLGRQLYYETRLSKNQMIACNTCHALDRYGIDVRGGPFSLGHANQLGGRNAPTVYHAAFHLAQFWDGREPDVEAQAGGPILNPIEMAMDSEAAVIAVLRSIPGYDPLFRAALPGEPDPFTYDNLKKAIGAFERRLVTPAAIDLFMNGDDNALTPGQLDGAQLFVNMGCADCHDGPALGGGKYKKLCLMDPCQIADKGRSEITMNPMDDYHFKVPSLRNVTETGPYLHDGSLPTLQETVMFMARHQLGMPSAQIASIIDFLHALTGPIDMLYIAPPPPLPPGPTTPPPMP